MNRPRKSAEPAGGVRHPWLLLTGSGVLEAVWASALAASQGFTKPVPVVIFVVASIFSMIGLGRAMKAIPVGTAYAIWTGIGAALTVAWAMGTGTEGFSWVKVLLLGGVIGAVIGLKFLEPPAAPEPADSSETLAG